MESLDIREFVDIVSQGQRALTKIESIKAIIRHKKYDSDAVEAISAILCIEEGADKDA